MALRTRAGDLDQRLTILRTERVSDGGGGYEETLVPIGPPVWGRVVPLAGSELIVAQQAESRVNYQFVLRWRDDLDASQTVEWRGKRFNIRTIQDAGPRDGFITLLAETEPA